MNGPNSLEVLEQRGRIKRSLETVSAILKRVEHLEFDVSPAKTKTVMELLLEKRDALEAELERLKKGRQ